MIVEPAPAKINLALHIRRRRDDGYHDLETLFAFAADGDVVTVEAAEADSFTVAGPFAAALDHPHPSAADTSPALSRRGRDEPPQAAKGEGDNLVTRARDAFRETFDLPPVAIALEKNLPVASGIGGGSADAAATLRALVRLTNTDPQNSDLMMIARTLGADVPACVLGRTALGFGRGDELAELAPLGGLPLLLVNPLVPLSTAAMFAAWDGVDRGPISRTGTALDRARPAGNDFTPAAIAQAPAVAEILSHLAHAPGCTFHRLSGSGATCFGIFVDEASRDAAADGARRRGWWNLATQVR